MVVRAVHLSADVYSVCLTHALSNEKEEVMGLLIGEISEDVSYISAVIMLRRSCKQPDRVEISPEQLSAASTQAETYGQLLNRPQMRVVGWYHSHPHITVWPSHIDVRTQADYQLLDDCFVGIIFSVFNQDKTTKMNRIQVACFQSQQPSIDSDWERVEVPLYIKPTESWNAANIRSLEDLPCILRSEEDEAYARHTTAIPNLDLMTRLHNSAVYQSGMVKIDELLYQPLISSIEQRREDLSKTLVDLEQEEQLLQKKLQLLREHGSSEMFGEMV